MAFSSRAGMLSPSAEADETSGTTQLAPDCCPSACCLLFIINNYFPVPGPLTSVYQRPNKQKTETEDVTLKKGSLSERVPPLPSLMRNVGLPKQPN